TNGYVYSTLISRVNIQSKNVGYAGDEGLQGGKKIAFFKRNKAISLGIDTSKVGIEVQQRFLKDCTLYLKAQKSLVFATPLSTAFLSTSFVEDFQDSPDDEEDTRSSHEYMDDLEEEYQARALLSKSKSSSASASKSSMVKNKCLIAEAYESNEEEVLSYDNEIVKVKVLMALADDNDVVSKERTFLSEVEGFILPNHDTADESSVYSTPLPPLEKLAGAEPVSRPKTIKSILKSISTFKAEVLKGVFIIEPSLALNKDNKNTSALKINSASVGKLKNVKIEDDPPLAIDHFSKKRTQAKNPQRVLKSCKTCGSTVHTTTDHNDIEWFRRGKALQAKKAEALKSIKDESSNANRSKTPTKSGCLRHMTDIKSYQHKYVEQPGPKVVFGDDSTCTTEVLRLFDVCQLFRIFYRVDGGDCMRIEEF
ncbi:hypothetical protein Tco_0962763, partial [Tanacetum coccineum]